MAENKIELLIQARDDASKKLAEITKELTKLGGGAGDASAQIVNMGQATGGTLAKMLEFAGGMVGAQLAVEALGKAWHYTIGAMVKGVEAIDQLKFAQASLAAGAGSNDPSKNFESLYETSGKIVEKIYELDRAFIGTGDELLMLADSMVTFGMGIDLSTEKAQKQVVAFGNMMKMMTKGQAFQRQAYQEVRALMEGADVPGAMLVKKLEAAGVNVKQMVPAWREQGVLLEKIMELLPGYLEASGKIEKTLGAQKSSMETIAFKILRQAMLPAYDDITNLVKSINDSLMDQNGLTERGLEIVTAIQMVYVTIKAFVEAIAWTLENTLGRLASQIRETGRLMAQGGFLQMGEMGFDLNAPVAIPANVQEMIDQQNEDARDKALRQVMGVDSAGMKLAGRGSQATDAMMKAAEKIAKAVADMEDKVAIEAARNRGGDVEAAYEKARIDYMNRNAKIMEMAEAAGKAKDQKMVNRALALSAQERTDDEIKILEKQAAEAVKIIGKEVKDREKLEEDLAKAIERIRNKVADRDVQRQERYLALMEQYNETMRQAGERVARPWDAPGAKERERELNDFISEQNKLGALKRRGEAHLPGGIDPDRYGELMDKLSAVHAERMRQIEDTTSVATARVAGLWADMASGMQDQFQGLFSDIFRGELKTLSDYFNNFADLIQESFSRALANMLTEWIQTQARMKEGGAMDMIGKWIGGALGMGGGVGEGWTAPIEYTAKGNVFGGPKLFKFAQGIGMLGEAGPEAVMPLKRNAAGDLGVVVAGGGSGAPQAVSVQIVNETGQPAKVRESKAAFDGQQLIITAWIDGYQRDLYGMRSAMAQGR